jgi:hypothetical protein
MFRVFTILLLTIGTSSVVPAGVIANINSFSHRISSPLEIVLGSGTHTLVPIDQSQGGQYTAWNTWNSGEVSGCDANGKNCFRGWVWSYSLSSPSLGDVEIPPIIVDGTTGVYSNPALAFASRNESFQFTLNQTETISLFVRDGPSLYIDNVGGVSLAVDPVAPVPAPVPAPATALLLGGGVVLLSIRRRKRIGHKSEQGPMKLN